MFTHKDQQNPKEEQIKKSKDKRKSNTTMKKAKAAALEMRNNSLSLGSYTGTAHDGGKPTQDADDL